jgi:ATP-dependent DNA helicase RecQ
MNSTLLTYHGMALRLTGTSLAAADRRGGVVDFAKLLQDAVDLLEGDSGAFADADEQRDRLLQGYEYIFVDEYQDINEQQYALVSALVGRRLTDPDAKLSIMAVGDDDQNIYSFNGATVTPRASSPTRATSRRLNSTAALRLKASAMIRSGVTRRTRSR